MRESPHLIWMMMFLSRRKEMKSYDPKCYELAEYFLANAPDNGVPRIEALAGIIQQAIEDFLALEN
jgi:hypothetical protein